MTFKVTFEKMVPRSLSSGETDWLCVMEVQGISTRHCVFMDQQNPGTYVYRIFPDGGPVDWLKKWVNSEQDVQVWRTDLGGEKYFPTSEALIKTWQDVSTLVLKSVTKEIADEMDVSI